MLANAIRPFACCRKITLKEFHSLHKTLPSSYCITATVPAIGYTIGSPQKLQKSTSEKDELASSTILLQDGLSFQELPVMVKRTSDVSTDTSPSRIETPVPSVSRVDKYEVPDAVKEKLDRCRTIDDLFSVFETFRPEEVTPAVAAYALKCIADLQGNDEYRNEGKGVRRKNPVENFTRSAVLNHLFKLVAKSDNMSIVLEGLQSMLRSSRFRDEENQIVKKFCTECLLRVCDGQATIEEMYLFAALLIWSKGDYSEVLDQLWSGIIDKSEEINPTNLVLIYRLLPALKRSRGVVFRLLEKRTFAAWWQLSVQDIIEILSILQKLRFQPKKLLGAFTKWVNLHVHTVPEFELMRLVDNFQKLDHNDQNLKNALERYMKARNANISEPALVVSIISFCLHFRLQSGSILDNVATYFVKRANELTVPQVVSIVRPFGLLNYLPQDDYKFYTKLEEVVGDKFVQFRPEDLIETFLSCTYIQRYPLNFTKKIFNPYFLDRLSTIQDKRQLLHARNNLKLLDVAMTLECPAYRGPLLPRTAVSPQSLHRDGRLFRMVAQISDVVGELCGGMDNVSVSKVPAGLPFSEMYMIDFEIHLNQKGEPIGCADVAGITRKKAVVIHLPEHFCHGDGGVLIGQRASKVRHLQCLGYEVPQLSFDDVSRLLPKRKELKHFLRAKIFPEHQQRPPAELL